MGAEISILQDCEWGQSYSNDPWEIETAVLSNDDEISLFRVQSKDKQKESLLRSLTKHLKSLRHPYILHYVGFEETSKGPGLITEKVIPLEVLLPKMSSIEICAGLQNVLEGLEFLHERAKISHNNLHIRCVYVSGDGSWRLGGLEHACLFSAVTQELLDSSKNVREEESLTPEELDGKVLTDVEYGHSRDVYAFAAMTESLLEKLADLGDLTKTFELRIQDECLNQDPKLRPKVESLLQDRLFSTEFVEIAAFLKHVALKSDVERKEFFKALPSKLKSLPENLIGQRLVPSLLSRFVMLDPTATEYIIPSLLVPKFDDGSNNEKITEDGAEPLISETTFKQYVIPRLVRIFSVRDFHIHLTLLKYFKSFVHLIDPDTLELEVFPHVLLGLRDTSDEIAALSLHALAEMVPILGRDIIIGGQSKSFFKEAMPKKNTGSNSPVNSFKHLNHGKKRKVLLKDMAKHSDKHSNVAENNRLKEKEKKREEMRKKREERKQAHDKAKQKNKEIQALNSKKATYSPLNNTISTIPESPKTVNQSVKQESESDQSKVNDESEKNQSTHWSDGEIDSGSPVANQHSDTESFVADRADDDDETWEDWNEKGDHSVESDISDEIEKELLNMTADSDVSVVHNQEKSPKHSIKQEKTSKSAMKLVPKRTKSIEKGEKDHDAVISEIEKSVQNSSSSFKKTITTASKQNKLSSTGKDLGSEFDIKTIDVKVPQATSDPFDFFADMAPKIESKNVSDVLKDGGKNLDLPITKYDSTNELSRVSFDVIGSNFEETEEGGGWGDDDW